jgi:hypothetical protein
MKPKPEVPWYAKLCIRLGTQPTDWYEMERCFQERYEEELAKGTAQATKFACIESGWFLFESVKRFLKP